MFNPDHPSFRDQPVQDAKVWRYMDLSRYLSLLQSESLHFARADQMSDRWEGSYSRANVALRPHLYGDDYSGMEQNRPHVRENVLRRVHMNCWHLANVESAAMWEIYQKEGRGVAVRSTWGALTSSITSNRMVLGGKVRYVDYSREFIPEGNTFDAFMHKRESFSHEKEVRLIMLTDYTEPHPTEPNTGIDLGPEPPVLPINVDLREVVKEVFVAPDAPSWIVSVVSNVTSRYGFNFPVRQSDLAEDPIA